MSTPPTGPAPVATIPGIEVLRGFAALAVFACHLAFLGGWTPAEQQRAVWFLASYGWAGVDLFFIISGFVIARSALRMRSHPDFIRSFWIHRLARIYPLYLLSLIAFLLLVDSGPVTGADAGFRILTHLLMLHAYFPSTSGTINPVTWSLGIEVSLYLLAFLLVWQRLLEGRLRAVLIVGILITLTYRAAVHALATDEASQIFLSLQIPGLMDGFLIGACLATLPDQSLRAIPKWLLVPVIVLLGLGAWHWLQSVEGRFWQSWPAPVLFRSLLALLGTALLLWSLQWRVRGILSNALATLGIWSYGIYLWHHMIILICLQQGWNRWELVATAIPLTIAAAWLSFRAFEQPAQSAIRRRLLPRASA